jgi:hypothetical protein
MKDVPLDEPEDLRRIRQMMLENAAPAPDVVERRGEAAAVIAGAVVAPAVALVIDVREVRPELARRVCDDGKRSVV